MPGGVFSKARKALTSLGVGAGLLLSVPSHLQAANARYCPQAIDVQGCLDAAHDAYIATVEGCDPLDPDIIRACMRPAKRVVRAELRRCVKQLCPRGQVCLDAACQEATQ